MTGQNQRICPATPMLASLGLALWAGLGGTSLRAQSWVHFGNNSSSLVYNGWTGLPVTSADGVKAALYFAPPYSSVFQMVGGAVDVGTPVPGAVTGGTREIVFQPDTTIRVQVRAWFGGHPSYEAAQASGAWVGQSPIVEMTTGGGGAPPTIPTSLTANGLQGFLVPHFLTPPPSIATLPATSLTSTSAILNATVTSRTWAVQVLFEWGTTNFDNSTPIQSYGSGFSPVTVQTAIAGLQAGTTYQFRAKVIYGGAGMLGDNRSFAWQPTAPVIEPAHDSHLGRLTLQFTGAIGQVYLVQTSTNLIEWTTAGGAVDLQNGGFMFEEAVTSGQKFYRVLLP